MSQVLAFAVGAGVALVAQMLGHSLTTQRERRTDLVRALDRAVSAYAEGERAMDDLTDGVANGQEIVHIADLSWPEAVETALADAERVRVDMRAALFSLRVRLDSDSPLLEAFDVAFDQWELAFLKCKVIMREEEIFATTALEQARGYAGRFRGEFYDVALERAAAEVGRINNVASRRWRWRRGKPGPSASPPEATG